MSTEYYKKNKIYIGSVLHTALFNCELSSHYNDNSWKKMHCRESRLHCKKHFRQEIPLILNVVYVKVILPSFRYNYLHMRKNLTNNNSVNYERYQWRFHHKWKEMLFLMTVEKQQSSTAAKLCSVKFLGEIFNKLLVVDTKTYYEGASIMKYYKIIHDNHTNIYTGSFRRIKIIKRSSFFKQNNFYLGGINKQIKLSYLLRKNSRITKKSLHI